MRHYVFPSLVLLLLVSIAILFNRIAARDYKNRAITTPEFSVHEYHKDGITYLVFKTQSGVAVVNYTSDSSEWIFLHTPTK